MNAEMTKDPRRAFQFYRKAATIAAAKAIGWQANDARPIDVMGFRLYAIMDEHCSMFTRAGYETLRAALAAGKEPDHG